MRKINVKGSIQTNERKVLVEFSLLWRGLIDALTHLPKWERVIHIFWLLGPFILLIERTPADVWLSLIALTFAARSIVKKEGWWLSKIWVKAAFFFWAICILAAAMSPLPVYSVGETLVWFRFPLFAMAVVFWLGRDKRLIYGMLVSMGVSTVMMCGILAAEIMLVGFQGQRLSWPYGDLVTGNYLAKACLPTFLVTVALATSAKSRIAIVGATFALASMIASIMTGERINFLIKACGGMLSSLAFKPKMMRVLALVALEGGAVVSALVFTPGMLTRYANDFLTQIPVHSKSAYFRAMEPGLLAFKKYPVFGIGPGNLRILCPELTGGSPAYDCHPHPHNFYIQMLGEVGLLGFLAGVLLIGSIIWTCARPAFIHRSNVVVATMWIVPFAFFWPIASTADFFGQWSNIFMWSSIAVALAGSQIERSGEYFSNSKL